MTDVQIYKAEEPHWPVRVYNLLYEDSQEADKFAAAVAREVSNTFDTPKLLVMLSCLSRAPCISHVAIA